MDKSHIIMFLLGMITTLILVFMYDMTKLKQLRKKSPVDHPHNRADGIDWDSITTVTERSDEDIHHVSLYGAQPYTTIHQHQHVHVLETGKCLKNRYGPRCL